jgi:paraquat-inducible protein B
MPDSPDRDEFPQATVVPRRRARISVVWLIPILAAVVAVGIAVQRIMSEGPTITIVFKGAEGIEAGKTFVKYKDVNIGQVTAVRLSSDYSKVEVTAKMAKTAAGLMVEDARFWVVEPRVTLSGISGLGTLLSGNYIGFEAGKSNRSAKNYTGLEVPPVVTGGQPGRRFQLKADDLGSLGIGAPIYYRRLQAGQIIAYKLASDGKSMDIEVFINAPYDKYVDSNTRFWNASGIDVSVGATGIDVRTQSLVALLAGGIAFENPLALSKAAPTSDDKVFTLFADRAAAMKEPDPISQHYVLYFDESLRGLSVGAPVTLLGLPAGEVNFVGLQLDPQTLNVRGRVEIVAYPERLLTYLAKGQAAAGLAIAQSAQRRHAVFQRLVEERGMRAQLRSGNVLTGQLYVAFDYFPNAPRAKIDWSQDAPTLPVQPSIIPDLENRITSIIAKLDKLPYDQIGADVTKALASLDTTLKDASAALKRVDSDVTPELNRAIGELRQVLATADGILKSGLSPALDEATATLKEARRPLATADGVLKNVDTAVLGKNAPVIPELRDALREITLAAKSLRDLMDYLERHPESLIRGKTGETP